VLTLKSLSRLTLRAQQKKEPFFFHTFFLLFSISGSGAIMFVAELDIPALIRSTLIFLHVLLLAGAAIAIAFADYSVFRSEVVDREMLIKSSRAVIGVLCGLWLTGFLIIGIDLQTNAITWLGTPKLQAKLCVVMALSINGYFLHNYAIHSLGHSCEQAEKNARRDAILGAISGVSWVYALFLGVARPWAPVLGFLGFMAIYGLALMLATVVALKWIRPVLLQKSRPQEVDVNTSNEENNPKLNPNLINGMMDSVPHPKRQPFSGVANG
jgi:hypothetical protein